MSKRAPRAAARLDRPLVISLALVALTAIVYAPVRTFELVNWDDPSYISDNPIVRGGLTWTSAKWALTTTHSPYWHPMTWLSLLLDVSLFGGDSGAYHVTNLVIHILTVVVLFLTLRRMTGATGPSAFVAAIFSVHPLHVESVAWIAERKDVLSTLFWALTMSTYLWYARSPSLMRYLAVALLYALALMSKPMVMTLPVLLLLLDFWPLARSRAASMASLAGEKVPLLAMATAVAIETMIVQRRVGAVAGLDALPISARLENAIVSGVVYVWKTLWPTHLAAFYPFEAYPLPVVALAAMALTAATIGAVMVRARFPHITVGWLWFLVTVAPVIGLTQAGEQARADRFMYVPMIGLILIVAYSPWPQFANRARAPLACALIALSAVAARAQVMTWSDGETLWRHAIDVVPRNYVAYQNLGETLRDRNRFDEAMANLRLALANAPPNSPGFQAMVHNDMGLVLSRTSASTDAAGEFDAAVRLSPRFAEAQLNLANALAAEGRPVEAERGYLIAIALKPDLVEPQIGLGGVLLQQRRPADAIPHYEAALRIAPSLAPAHNGLGAAYAIQGRDAEAMREYDEALRLDPELVTTHFNVAVLMLKQGRTDEARRHLDAALRIDPDYVPARQLRERVK